MISAGDKIRHNGDFYYVVSTNGQRLWITDEEHNRYNKNASGWYLDVRLAELYDEEGNYWD